MKTHTRQGFAMVAVLAFTAVAAVTCAALLSASSFTFAAERERVQAARVDLLVASAEAVATYYLLHPEHAASPPTVGGAGQRHYAGSDDVFGDAGLASGAVRVAVNVNSVRPFVYDLLIDALAPDGEVLATSRRRAIGTNAGRPLAGLITTGNKSVRSNVIVTGGMATNGTFLGGNSISGPIYASGGGTRTIPADFVLPRLPYTIRQDGLHYIFDGAVFNVSPQNDWLTQTSQNPGRLFFYTSSSDHETKASREPGVLISTHTGAKIELEGTIRITAPRGMPVLDVAGDLEVDDGIVRLTGLVIVRGDIEVDSDAELHVHGALVWLAPGSSQLGENVNGQVHVHFDPAAATVPRADVRGDRVERVYVISLD